MEPFPISCLVLIFYCGYLTVSDLLNDMKVVPVVAVQRTARQIKRKFISKQRISGKTQVPVPKQHQGRLIGEAASVY
jgi:hypothetical protein